MQIGHVWIIKLQSKINEKTSTLTARVNIRATCTALIISTCTTVLNTFLKSLKKKKKFISDESATLWLHKGLQNISNLFRHLRTKYFHSSYLPSRVHLSAGDEGFCQQMGLSEQEQRSESACPLKRQTNN